MRERAVRRPELPATRLELHRLAPSRRSLAVALAIVTGAALAYLVARETPLFGLRSLVVQGAPPVVDGQIRGALADDLGSSLVTLDGDDVVRRLEGLPTVVSARYDRDFPHTLRLFVEPEQPVAVFRRGSESWLVSARGRVMARLDAGGFQTLPRVWVDPDTVMRLGALLGGPSSRTAAALAALPTSPFAGRVSTARTDGRTLTLVLRSGLELRLGRPAQLELKFAAARAVLATTTRAARGAGSYLDLAVPERPVGHFNLQAEG